MVCRYTKSWNRTPSRKRHFCNWKDAICDIFWSFQGWRTWYQIFGTNISIDWISRKLDRAKHSLHAQASWLDVHSTPCTAKRVPCTYREPCARLAFWSNRAEASLHAQASLLDVQSILCTIRHAMVSPRKRSPLVRSRRTSCLEIICWIQGRCFVYDKLNKCLPNVRHVQKSMWTFTLNI